MPADQSERALERLIFFSDAVFAIAITLLIIEVHPPHISRCASDHHHLIELAKLVPNFVGFAVSFAVVGAFWAGHHRAFMLTEHYSPGIVIWNLLLLASIAFIPFVTAYASDYSGERVPTMLYCGWLLVSGLLNLKVNRMATSAPMAAEHVDARQRAHIRRRGLGVILGATTALIVSYFAPVFGQLGLISIPAWRQALARLERA